MEAWVIACIVFVFAALMEYTGILLQVTLMVEMVISIHSTTVSSNGFGYLKKEAIEKLGVI